MFKKTIFIISFCILFAACTNQDTIVNSDDLVVKNVDSTKITENIEDPLLFEACQNWELSKTDIKEILNNSQEISSTEWNSNYYHLPCEIEGTIAKDGVDSSYHVNAGATLVLTAEDNIPVYYGCSQESCEKYFLIMPDTPPASGTSKNEIAIQPLITEDLQLVFKNLRITSETKVENIINKLGLPEDYVWHNEGYISGNSEYRRWNLSYPTYDAPEIRMIILSKREYVGDEAKDGESYIVGIYLESYGTRRGLKVGDSFERVLELYGTPELREGNNLKYSKGNHHIVITLDEAGEIVKHIFFDYNMTRSLKGQS